MPLGCIYVQPSLCHSHWCIPTPMATLGTAWVLVYTYSVGFRMLFVSQDRVFPGTSNHETSKQQCRASRFLFVFTLL